jgi:hypothetical protein
MMSYNNLINYYKTIFVMAQHHKYSITEIEEMVPYERDLYFDMIVEFIEEQKNQQKQR